MNSIEAKSIDVIIEILNKGYEYYEMQEYPQIFIINMMARIIVKQREEIDFLKNFNKKVVNHVGTN